MIEIPVAPRSQWTGVSPGDLSEPVVGIDRPI